MNLFSKNLMNFNLKSDTKENVIKEIVEDVNQNIKIDSPLLIKRIQERERISTTGVGNGVAIPHAILPEIKDSFVYYGKSEKGINYNSLDDKPVHHFFLIVVPEKNNKEHLDILAKLSSKLMHDEVIKKLDKSKNYDDVIEAFSFESNIKQDTNRPFDYLAVTGCATGIAHTYMAKEKLEQKANELGLNIKVETNGSSGVENQLTHDEIKEAKGIIIASDIRVEMNRFANKKVLRVPVAKAIHEPEKLFEEVNNAKVFESDQPIESTEDKGLYQHLMSGISYMLPFVVGGGIFIALSFMIDQLLGVPQDALAQLGSYNRLASIFNEIGGTAFGFMLPVLAGFIAYGISDRPGLLLGFVAGGLANAGGSGFLGALVGGFLAGFVMNFVRKILKGLPKSLDGIKTILLFPVIGLLFIGILMMLINVPMKAINDGMNSFLENLSGANAIVLGLVLGAMMALDLGGPVNKAAYVFGTGTLAALNGQGSAIMAAVMAAGMVPPLAVFVATKLKPKLFTEQELQAGNTNVILGASFITEGAIPFASKNPLRVIPSYMIGSAITGALVMMSQISVNAPHGGIFVIFLVTKPILYLIYIILGSLISGVLMASFLNKQD